MKNLFNRLVYVCAVLLMVSPLVSCGGGGGGGAGTGTLDIKLTDKTTNEYEAIYVTILEVQFIKEGLDDEVEDNWDVITIPAETSTFNLLELVNRTLQDLGVADIEEGHYNQMRLILGSVPDDRPNLLEQSHDHANYLILKDEQDQIPLKVPSGLQTGIKLVNGFDIYASETTELVLDFDALRSVVKAGNSGNWLLKPTIKVVDTQKNTLSGFVYNFDDASILEDTLVSAQAYDSEASNVEGQITVPYSTISVGEEELISVDEEEFSYSMFIPLGTHNIVAFKEGFFPVCSEVETVPIDNHREDFTLEQVSVESLWTVSGVVSGLVDTTEGQEPSEDIVEPSASLSIRQKNVDCDGDGVDNIMIELVEVNRADGSEYSIDLPNGAYQIVAWADGEETQIIDFSVVGESIVGQNITFPEMP